jgi:hypothetical protein
VSSCAWRSLSFGSVRTISGRPYLDIVWWPTFPGDGLHRVADLHQLGAAAHRAIGVGDARHEQQRLHHDERAKSSHGSEYIEEGWGARTARYVAEISKQKLAPARVIEPLAVKASVNGS